MYERKVTTTNATKLCLAVLSCCFAMYETDVGLGDKLILSLG